MLKLKNPDYRTKLNIDSYNDGAILTISQSKTERLRYIVPKEQIEQIINELQNQIKE